MGAMKPWHWVVLILAVLILFGAKRLPDMASSLGKSLKIFKKEVKELQEDSQVPEVTNNYEAQGGIPPQQGGAPNVQDQGGAPGTHNNPPANPPA